MTSLHCFLDCPSGDGEVPLLHPALCIRCLPDKLKWGRGREGESGVTPGYLTLPHPLQLPSHSSLKPPFPTMPKLLASVTSPTPCSIELSGTPGPPVLQGTVERLPSTPQEFSNILTWAVKVVWSRRTLKTQDTLQISGDLSHSRGGDRFGKLAFLGKLSSLLPRLLSVLSLSPYLSNADKHCLPLGWWED